MVGIMEQAEILTVTLNPALDLTTGTEMVMPDVKLRCDSLVTDPGGGGINVSRAIAVMGGQSTALVALGGGVGRRMAEMLDDAGLPVISLPAPGETRQSLAVTDHSTRKQYRFVMPGPRWSESNVEWALEAIAGAARPGMVVVLSGSNPPGVPADFARRLTAALTPRGARLVVDTSGPALKAVAEARDGALAILRMDDVEAEDLAGHPLPTRVDSADFAASLVALGVAQWVMVARGRDGNIIATPEGRWHAEALPVEVVSKVGAGDSFLAGFVLSMARGGTPAQAIGLAAAAASAACMTPATELCRAEDVWRLEQQGSVTPI